MNRLSAVHAPAPSTPAHPPILAAVNCNGKRHHIALQAGAALVLLDHTRHQLRKEFALVDLGGEPCRCLRVLFAWRRTVAGDFSGQELPRRSARPPAPPARSARAGAGFDGFRTGRPCRLTTRRRCS
jgi:hypothetical protein